MTCPPPFIPLQEMRHANVIPRIRFACHFHCGRHGRHDEFHVPLPLEPMMSSSLCRGVVNAPAVLAARQSTCYLHTSWSRNLKLERWKDAVASEVARSPPQQMEDDLSSLCRFFGKAALADKLHISARGRWWTPPRLRRAPVVVIARRRLVVSSYASETETVMAPEKDGIEPIIPKPRTTPKRTRWFTPCEAEGCHVTEPCYGFPGGLRVRCSKHKLEGMENLKHKRCEAPGCQKMPAFGTHGLPGVSHCGTHKGPGMVLKTNRACTFPDCKRKAKFASVEGGRPSRCSKHKDPDMVDVVSQLCQSPGCKKHPCYGFTSVTHCKLHKSEGMLPRGYGKYRCGVRGCGLRGEFGFQGDGEKFLCERHKVPGMVYLHEGEKLKSRAREGQGQGTSIDTKTSTMEAVPTSR